MDVSALVTGITGCVQLAKTLKDVDKDIEVKSVSAELYDSIINLQSTIMGFQADAFNLQQQNQLLQKQLEEIAGWEEEKERYTLEKLGGGCFVYALKRDAIGMDPEHYLCPTCYNNEKKSILQYYAAHMLRCYSCDQDYFTEKLASWP